MPIYFAYGSNMDYDQMKQRCPNLKFIGKALLEDHKIGFTSYSAKWDSAVADILVTPGENIWGVLYEITDEDLIKLDRYEGHPIKYKRNTLIVNKLINERFDFDDEVISAKEFVSIEAQVYEVVNKNLGLQPKLNYLTVILDAAFNRNFPIQYQKTLSTFGYTHYNEKLGSILDVFLNLETILKKGKFPAEMKKQEEWGGANLVITGLQERVDQLKRDYPYDLVVLTKHWKEVSWLIDKIYKNETLCWQVDAANKHYYFSELGVAAQRYQKDFPNDKTTTGLCLAVLYAAYKIITIDFYKQF